MLLVPALALGEATKPEPSSFGEWWPAHDPHASAPHETSSEYFLVEWAGENPHPWKEYRGAKGLEHAAREGHLGLVEIHRRPVARGWQLEQEIVFPFEEMRLLAVECLSASSPRLVWREIGANGGRTIFSEWTAESERLKVLEWGVDGSLRESLETSQGAVMPQYLLDLVRTGKLAGGRFRVFDPLLGELDDWELEVRYLREGIEGGSPDRDPVYRRRAEFRRGDGTLAGRYTFEGEDLVEFQWQAGQVVVRRISQPEYVNYRALWGLDEAPETTESGALGAVKDL